MVHVQATHCSHHHIISPEQHLGPTAAGNVCTRTIHDYAPVGLPVAYNEKGEKWVSFRPSKKMSELDSPSVYPLISKVSSM
jgi:hypothetical protein